MVRRRSWALEVLPSPRSTKRLPAKRLVVKRLSMVLLPAMWLAALGCDRSAKSTEDAEVPSASPSASPSGSGATSGPAPASIDADGAGPPRASEADWQLAAAGDPLDLARLARTEGALRLVAELTGARAETALAALPHAPDAELAVGALCRSLDPSVKLPPKAPTSARARLEALNQVLAEAERSVEGAPLRGQCAPILKRLEAAVDPADLPLVKSAQQALTPQ
ncbi:MAG: hypothetical protein KIT72_12880 [Polyangiaceae bacterium]|nr:hypothetical protein [Polyangiaceae bacterium]MCW5791306.1 hypothetical protein [Polyangiaceae bacterium]